MALSDHRIRSSYDATANYYDLALKFYALIGIRKVYRLRAVELLRLKPGDRVIELGCGTGINFPFIIDRIGPEGHLVGVDISPKMLACAGKRAERHGWQNVELVESNIALYDLPEGINAVLSTGVFGYISDYDRVIENISNAIVPGGRIVIMDGKRPDKLPGWIFRFVVRISRAFGVTSDYFDKCAWRSVDSYFEETEFRQMYGGMIYISAGTALAQTAEQSGKKGQQEKTHASS